MSAYVVYGMAHYQMIQFGMPEPCFSPCGSVIHVVLDFSVVWYQFTVHQFRINGNTFNFVIRSIVAVDNRTQYYHPCEVRTIKVIIFYFKNRWRSILPKLQFSFYLYIIILLMKRHGLDEIIHHSGSLIHAFRHSI